MLHANLSSDPNKTPDNQGYSMLPITWRSTNLVDKKHTAIDDYVFSTCLEKDNFNKLKLISES